MFGETLLPFALLAVQAASPEAPREPIINTGVGLLENCTVDAPDAGEAEFHLGLCIGFIKGVTNTWVEQRPDGICPPEQLDNQALRDIVVNWLRSHPKALGAPAVGSVVAAVTEAFPCREQVQEDRQPSTRPGSPEQRQIT